MDNLKALKALRDLSGTEESVHFQDFEDSEDAEDSADPETLPQEAFGNVLSLLFLNLPNLEYSNFKFDSYRKVSPLSTIQPVRQNLRSLNLSSNIEIHGIPFPPSDLLALNDSDLV